MAPGVAAKIAGKELLGFMVSEVKIAAHTAKAIGLAWFLPDIGRINGAAKLFGIDKGFHQHQWMAAALLPIDAGVISCAWPSASEVAASDFPAGKRFGMPEVGKTLPPKFSAIDQTISNQTLASRDEFSVPVACSGAFRVVPVQFVDPLSKAIAIVQLAQLRCER